MNAQNVFNRCMVAAVTLFVVKVFVPWTATCDTILFGMIMFLLGAATGVGYAGGLFRKGADAHAE